MNNTFKAFSIIKYIGISAFLLISIFSNKANAQCYSSFCNPGGFPTAVATNVPINVVTGGAGFTFDLTITLPVGCAYMPYTGPVDIIFQPAVGAPVSLTLTGGSIGPGGTFTFTGINFPNNLLSAGTPGTGTIMIYKIQFGFLNSPGCPTDATDMAIIPASISINVIPAVPPVVNNVPASICANNGLQVAKLLNPKDTVAVTLDGSPIAYNPLDSTFSYNPGTNGTHTLHITYTKGGIVQVKDTIFNTMAIPVVTAMSNIVGGSPANVCPGVSVTLYGNGANSYLWSGGVVNNVPFNILTSAIYTVTGLDANGCTASATFDITVTNLNLFVTTIPANGQVIIGGQATVTATGAGTFSWTGGINNGVAFTPTATTTYTVTCTSTNNCTQQATAVITVLTAAALQPKYKDVPATICTDTLRQKAYLYNPSGLISIKLDGAGLTYNGFDSSFRYLPGPIGTHTLSTTYYISGNFYTKDSIFTTIASPTITLASVPNSNSICKGQPVKITASGAIAYTWSIGGNADSTIFTPSTTTPTINVVATAANGCTAIAPFVFTMYNVPVLSLVNPATTNVCAGQNTLLNAIGATNITWSGGLINNANAVLPAGASTYTIVGVNGPSCSASSIVTLTAALTPVITISTFPNDTVCKGEPIQLEATASNSNIAWTNGYTNNAFITPNGTTTYSVIATSTNNNLCTAIALQTVVVNNPININLSITASIPSGNIGDSVTYFASTNLTMPYTISWYRNNVYQGSTTTNTWGTHIIAGPNAIKAIISNPYVCMQNDSVVSNNVINTLQNAPAALNNLNLNGIYIYPNPASTVLNFNGLSNTDIVSIYNQTGALVYTNTGAQILNNNNIVDVNNFDNGMYIIKLLHNETTLYTKITKQ